ncbi:MAG: glycoside hydrolase family 97 C-terminal domain-containing protein, partial [Prevotella sp.]|nr:glycoside hydrolase family 97 C-terminal domain-containing protein [Prevotella sp.]
AGIARRKGDVWYVGILNNWEARDIELSLSFINGQKRAEIIRDGINADQEATDYHRLFRNVTREMSIKIHLAPGGGWAAIIR